MDLCSLEDAFPNIETGSIHKTFTGSPFPYVGGTDSKPSREERRAARKRAKKVKGPAQTYFESIAGDIPPTDPDRPAVKRMDSVTPEQDKKDGFAIPVLPKASCLVSDAGTPSYFGKSYDDESEEGFSSFSAALDDNPNYNISPEGQDITQEVQKAADFKNSFDLKTLTNINNTYIKLFNKLDKQKLYSILDDNTINCIQEYIKFLNKYDMKDINNFKYILKIN